MQIDPSDSVIAAHLSQRGCFEPYETRLVQQLIKPGQNVIDVGANIGYYSLQFAKLVGASGRVLAFEPDPDNYRLLCQNVARNGYANVTTIPKAVSSQSGTLRLFRNPHNKGDHRVYAGSEPGREVVEVEAVSLDEYVGQLNLPIDVIKFDIQGAEGSAFLGMQRLLKNNPNIQIITEFWPRGLTLCGHDPREFLEQLVALGFKVQVIDETKEQLEDLSIERVLERYPIEPDTDIFFTNLLCCRRAA
jgi:FkbM family methyltransferase